jgi:microcin C transport system permease protein
MTLRLFPVRLNPLTRKKLRRFRSDPARLCLVPHPRQRPGRAVAGRRAARQQPRPGRPLRGPLVFPTYGAIHTGREFGLRLRLRGELPRPQAALRRHGPLGPPAPRALQPHRELLPRRNLPPPPARLAKGHYLGTDQINRDILARLLYGFRNALIFSSCFIGLTYLIGITLGCLMGYFGGWFDLLVQRLIEIWSNIPFLFVVIIVASVVPAGIGMNLWILLAIVVLFSWTGMTYYMRSATYREKARDYVHAAQVLGASTGASSSATSCPTRFRPWSPSSRSPSPAPSAP